MQASTAVRTLADAFDMWVTNGRMWQPELNLNNSGAMERSQVLLFIWIQYEISNFKVLPMQVNS